MPTVSALRATRRGGVALHVDGEYVCTVTVSLIARWRLFKGRELDDEALAALRGAAAFEHARADAHRLLGHRARGIEELRRRLVEKGHDESTVATVVAALVDEGVLDDEAFARCYVADKRALSGWGGERIRRELLALGVSADTVAAALHEGSAGDEDELARAVALLIRKGPPQPPLGAARRRAYQALLRRGFAAAIAYAAVTRWSGGAPPEGELTR